MAEDFEWPDDDLSKFLQTAELALRSTLTDPSVGDLYEFVSATNEYLRRFIAKDMELRPERAFTREMLLRAHGAFYGAARLGLSGQVPEAYMVARGVVEAGLFGFIVHCSPELETVWRDRHKSTEELRACRREFSAEKAFKKIDSDNGGDGTFANDLRNLYDDLIDHGGHPNVNASVPHHREHKYVEGIENDTATVVTVGTIVFITNNPQAIHRCIRSVVKAGMAVLRLYQIIHPDVVAQLDLAEQIKQATDVLWRQEIYPTLPARR